MSLSSLVVTMGLCCAGLSAAMAEESRTPTAAESFEDSEFGTYLGDGAFFCLFGTLPRRLERQEPRKPDRQALLRRFLNSLKGNYSGSAQDTQETLAISQFSVNSWAIAAELDSGMFHGDSLTILAIKDNRLFAGMNRDGSDGKETEVLELSDNVLSYRYDPRPDIPEAPVFTERFELGADSLRHEATVADKNGKRLQSREFFLRRIK